MKMNQMKQKIMRSLLSGFACCALLAAFTSCEEKDFSSHMPVYSGIVLDKDVIAPGDSVTFTAKQSTPGKLINGTNYTWTIKDSHDSTLYTVTQNVIYDYDPSDPVLGYRIPGDARTGTYTVSFSAYFKYSGQGTVVTGGGASSGATYGTYQNSIDFKVGN